MMTWLPYPSYEDSLACLSHEDLYKQQIDIIATIEYLLQSDESLLPPDYSVDPVDWIKLAKMWQGYELQLIEYGLQTVEVLSAVAKQNINHNPYYNQLWHYLRVSKTEVSAINKPNWWGDVIIHNCHKSQLCLHNPDFYRPAFGKFPAYPEMIWPESDLAVQDDC